MKFMSIFRQLSYRDLIRNLLKASPLTAQAVSERLGLHGSYFSRVLKGGANFSNEQLFGIGKLFALDDPEIDYLLLLGEYDRSGSHAHRQFVRRRIDDLREEKLKLSENLENVEVVGSVSHQDHAPYYFESVTAKIHMFLCIDKFRLHSLKISDKIGITPAKLQEELRKLAQLRLISLNGEKITVLRSSILLDENDPISPVNHGNWRLEAIQKLSRRLFDKGDYHCTVNFTADQDTAAEIRDAFKEFMVQAQRILQRTKNETDVFTICFDLFRS
jgi:transcriptional regulator with XRE-family HTH domain